MALVTHVKETPEPSFPSMSLQEEFPSDRVDKKRIWSFYGDRWRFIVGIALFCIVGISVIGSLLVYYPFSPHAKADVQSGSRPASQAVPPNAPAWTAYDKSIVDPGAKPVLDDPLTRPGPGPSWHVGSHCNYVGGVYHEYNESVNYCPNEGPIFYDFEFHIVMRMTQGEEAGIIFRADGNSHLYYFYLDIHGNYGIHLSDDTHSKDLIPRTASPAIKQGLGQPNQLAVIAHGKDITLYINGQYVDHIQDTNLSVGRIGVCVGDYHDFYPAPFNATYQDAKVWNLKS